ncbi:NADPH2:quinone reductase [Geodermatophilus bullaregiensis]|uniref:quinone oxidoreductase family protein n=1 Tax=Geodermatophilus bullaregiensis TaxID=1564160 RepID=UPI001957903B|nr:quinone oxidoreductase [Geodermatophilus bullaregiensis]MBM7804347.1 NADPH2:quinone reductase [Geodermatophilus bullaregiensis]
MQAVVYERTGGPEVLTVREVPDPEPGDGEVLVDVEAVGVNFRDVYEREGRPPYTADPPAVLGAEGAGRVVGTGERVAWLGVPGSYAARVAAPRAALVPVPDGVGSEVAAAVLLQGCTAQYLAADSHPVAQGEWVVVHSAAGGVGLLLTQLVRDRGGHVLATTSTEEKAELARAAGADEVVVGYDGFAERVRELSGGEGAAAVYDGVGRTTFADGLRALRPTGRMIVYGAASGQPEPLEVQRLAAHGSLYVQRPTLATYTRTPEMLRERAGAVLDLVAAGRLDVRIGARLPLAQARRAHEDLEGRRTTGKVLLLP